MTKPRVFVPIMQIKVPLSILLILAALAGPGQGLAGQGGGASSAGQAAAQVASQTGGRVLSVQEKGGGWVVKVLTPSGEVRSVFVPKGGR